MQGHATLFARRHKTHPGSWNGFSGSARAPVMVEGAMVMTARHGSLLDVTAAVLLMCK